MSWLTNLIQTTNANSTGVDLKKTSLNLDLYISIENTRVCFLVIDNDQKTKTILSRKEVFLGPVEDLEVGRPVRDLFGALLKVFTVEKDVFQGKKNISVSIPAEGVFFRNVEVPKMEPASMQRLVLAEIKKTLPVDFSEVLFAQNDLGEMHENMRTFFCVGIQKLYFENFKSLFSKFGINPYFEIEVFSLARIPDKDKVSRIIIQIERTSSFAIFLEGQIIQDVKMLDFGVNDIHQSLEKDYGIMFNDAEMLRSSFDLLKETGKMSTKVFEEYFKMNNKKISKVISAHILDYEKKHSLEVKEIVISGLDSGLGLKKSILEEFDAELKVDFLNEASFDMFVAENFSLDELKRYAQCFGLAKREK